MARKRQSPVSIGGGTPFAAYGNLYKTQECLGNTQVSIPEAAPSPAPAGPLVNGSCSFQDVRGNRFDALDRSLAKYEVAVGNVGAGRAGFAARRFRHDFGTQRNVAMAIQQVVTAHSATIERKT